MFKRSLISFLKHAMCDRTLYGGALVGIEGGHGEFGGGLDHPCEVEFGAEYPSGLIPVLVHWFK